MTPAALRARLEGAIAFPVTPFRDDLSLDVEGLRRNIGMMAVHPLAAVVAAGGTGELYSLTPEEHLETVRAVVEAVDGRMPVIAGAGFNVALGPRLAKQAADAGASGILAFPPYYPNADDAAIVDYYRAIADATPLGVLIYSRDWFHPGAATVERLASIPTLIAWKDGQGDIRRLQILQAAVGDRLLWIGGAGDDMIAAYYATGIRAFTSSVANVAPEMAVRLHETAASGDRDTLARLMRDYVVPMYELRGRRRGYEVTVMKELMNAIGLAGGRVRPPLAQMTDADLADVRRFAQSLAL